jgi:hypothetical protein
MLGRILNSLSYRLKRVEAEWRSENLIRREMAYGPVRGVLMGMAERPVRWPAVILVILAIVSFGLTVLPPSVPRIILSQNPTEAVNYFSVPWSVQAAVAALVYPIVLAFVTIVVQRRNAKSILHIYLHDSAAIISGLMALFLLIFMGIQYLFLTVIPIEVAVSWIVVDSVWLAVNLGLTSFFLYRTFQFVRPAGRSKSIRQYTVNIVWPKELGEHLRRPLFFQAVENNLLPGPSYDRQENETGPAVWLGPGSSAFGTSVVECQLARHSRLTDIRFRYLAYATSSWFKRAIRHELAAPQPRKNRWRLRDEQPVLAYPIDPNSVYSGSTCYCRVIGPVQPSFLARLFIRFAFKFRRSASPVELTVGEILDDLKAEAMLFLHSGEPQAFSAAVDELVDFYILVFQASAFRTSTGQVDSYATVSGEDFFQPLYREWARRFADLSIAAKERLASDEGFFTTLIQVPSSLFAKLQEEAPSPILCYFVELPRTLFYHLGRWWVKTLEQQETGLHDACNSAYLRPPFFGTYNSILMSFVGTWESLKTYYFPPHRSETPTWLQLQQASPFFETHLNETALMLMESVHRGDQAGADNIGDVLFSWFGQLQFRFETHRYLFRRDTLLSFEVLKYPWDELQGKLGIEWSHEIPAEMPKAVFAVALQNYWIDVCCAIGYMLATRGKACECDRSIPARLLKAMILGTTLRKETNADRAPTFVRNANDLFMAILRQYHSEGAYRRGYRARLDRLIERLAEITREPMIPGRVYGWGGSDLNSVRDGQLILLALLVPETWTPLTTVEPTFREWVREDDSKLRELQYDLQQWRERLNTTEFGEYRNLFECIKGNQAGRSFEQAIASTVSGINEILAKIDTIRTERLHELTINPARLDEVGRWASTTGFSKRSGAFPLPLFRTINFAADQLDVRRSLILKGIAKGEFTEPEMAQRSVNEEEVYRHLLRDQVAASVLHAVIERLTPQQQDGSSAETYWEHVKRYGETAARQDRHAILLIENRTVPEWIYNWTNRYRGREAIIPSDMKAWHDPENHSDAYVGNLNDIAVYVAPLQPDGSILMTAESFDTVSFTKVEDDRFVSVEAIPIPDESAIIDLRLTWSFDLRIDQYPAIKLSYAGRRRRARRN